MDSKILNHPTKFTRPISTRREFLGLVGYVEIYIEPSIQSTDAKEYDPAFRPVLCLRVISQGGTLFTKEDLDDMGLDESQLKTLSDLSANHQEKLYHRYLPESVSSEARMFHEHCFIDRDGFVRVSCILSLPRVHLVSE